LPDVGRNEEEHRLEREQESPVEHAYRDRDQQKQQVCDMLLV
jgi:hypothetical protein